MANKRDVDVLGKPDIVRKILFLRLPWQRALVAFLYLTGARIGEALAVQKKDISAEGKYVIVKLMTEKKTMQEFRNVPINVESDAELYEFVSAHISWLQPEHFLFKVSRQRAWQVLKRIGLFPHVLRHFRATHLSKVMTDQQLTKYFGWTDSRPARYYTHLKWQDLADKVG